MAEAQSSAQSFFRYWVNDRSFIRGAARLLIAPVDRAFPTKIGDVIELSPSATGQNDVQTLSPVSAPSGGTFKLKVNVNDGQGVKTTTALDYDSTASEIQAALIALSNIGPSDVGVTGATGATGGAEARDMIISFTNDLEKTFIDGITVDSLSTIGGSYKITHTTPGGPDRVQYDAEPGWTDLGATKTGIQITINNTEETFDIDQQLGIIGSQPVTWECSVGTALAESTPERMQEAWMGSAITVDDTPDTGPEMEIGFGAPYFYNQRRLAVLFQRPSGLIRAYFFRKAQRTPQESSITHAKTGEQQSIPVRFNVLADNTEPDPQKQFFIIRDQAVN